jgi:hypothetical protein
MLEPNDQCRGLGPCTAISLLRSAVLMSLEVEALPDDHRPDTFGTVDLVGRDRSQIDTKIVHTNGDLAE